MAFIARNAALMALCAPLFAFAGEASSGLIVMAKEGARGQGPSTFTVLNAGATHLTGIQGLVAADGPGLESVRHNCPAALAPRARCEITARWSQGRPARGARLLVKSNERAEPVSLSIPIPRS